MGIVVCSEMVLTPSTSACLPSTLRFGRGG